MYQSIFSGILLFFFTGRWSFPALWLWGKQATRVYTTPQVWVLAGLRGAYSRNLASDHGETFRPTPAKYDSGNPAILDYALVLAAAIVSRLHALSHRPREALYHVASTLSVCVCTA